ncbi:hypothetical protein GCM10023194_39080 [Planotetraspora phitsanulokensis]|uniref:Alpha-L-fucosidase n=1 Tax=Planotetraspora phitsanulokensis TaxID=575192 RepID=A0A8J3UMS2_9ACTN|nr:discoidin domain-containing protein [Planotetraspora phitsanulokensis]GII41565.1 hypothetical protein Pph01_65680 [Planotetraspora phitsanulokensis]
MKLRRTLSALAGAAMVVVTLAVPSQAAAARQIHVAKTGNDANAGTSAAPYLTIDKAAQEAQPGDTVVVHAGLYREWVRPARGGTGEDARITYTSAGDGEVVIKGSEEIDTWTRYSGDVWKVTLPDSYFGDFNPYSTGQPQGGEGGTFPGYTAGDVYLNEQAYYEKPSLSAVQSAADTWFAEVGGVDTTIYANFDGNDPNAKLAEINVRRQVFAPEAWGLGYITVHGFTVKDAAGTYSDFPSSPSRRQAGAISVNGGLKWIIEQNTVVNARTIAIDIGLGCDEWAGNRPGQTRTDFHDTAKYGSHIVRNNYIAKAGQSGIAGVFSWNSDILYNRIEDTNYRGEFSGAETAPIKVHYMNEGLIKGNFLKNSKGGNSAGIWTDWGNQNLRVTGNIVMNAPWGYYAEAVHGPILVDNNVFIGNSDIRMLDATGVVYADNLFVDNGRIAVDGGGRDAYYFQPGTMNESTALTSPQKFFWYNNLVNGSTLPADATDKTHVKEGNATGVLSNVKVNASATEVKLDFDLDASGIGGLTPVTKARVGVIPRAGESIAADVTTDFFGKPFSGMPGPFAEAKTGANSFTLWPPAGQTVPTPPAPPADVPVNLSLNPDAKVVASYEDGNLVATNAIDGNGSSRWSSDHSNDPNAWIYVDLGREYDVSKAVLQWEAAYGKSYKIQISGDAQHWEDVYSTTTGAGGVETITIRRDTRYVRMQGVQPQTQYGYSLYEFEIYGTPVQPDVPVNIALNLAPSAYTASSQSNDGSGPVNSQPQNDRSAFRAFDGNTATRWGSDGGDTQWIQVDTGKTHVIDKVVLKWEAAYASQYKIQTSADGTQWTDVHTHDDAAPTGDHVDEITLNPPVSGRYVRVQGVKAATQWGLSLWEFEVYGTAEPADTVPQWPTTAQLQLSAVTGTSANVAWPAATDNQGVTGYKVYLGQTLKGTLGADARDFALTGLAAGRTYTVKITALDAGGESQGLTKTFTTSGNSATRALSTTYPRTYADWEEGLLAGDGKQGIIVFGNPRDETVVFDDRDFFMARTEARPHRTFNTVSQDDIKRIRDLLIAGKYQEANQLAADVQGYQGGGEGSKHPGFKMTLQMPATGEVTNYVRSTDYSAGVVSVNWTDDKGDWRRDAFVSQTDGVAVQYLPAPAGQKLDVKLGLSIDPGMNLLNKGLTAVNASTTDFLNLRVKYPSGSYDAGYEGVTRIVTDGTKTMAGTDVQVTNASYIMLLSLTQRYDGTYEGGVPAEQEWNKKPLQAKLTALPSDYTTLRDRHVAKHSQMFDRVKVDFGASESDRSKSNEELLAEQKTATTPNLALFERMFNSGRYHLIGSSSPTAPPDLLGNWTGDSNVGWDGYYHLDANLNLQISGGNIGNLPEVMAGYWWINKSWQKDFRVNAQKLLGTRGMLTGGNTPNGEGLISNINFDYPYQYVTGGESWLLYPFWEYYQITGDRKFLEEQYYPLIRDMGDFYEDFLVQKDANGKYIFAGSISPENRPAGGVPLAVNSVYDISGARFALSTLIQTSKTLGKDADKIAVWQEKLDNLPPYIVNDDGALAEWAWPDLANKNAYQHRHSSGLMPVWPYREVTPEKNKALYDAAKVFLKKKDAGNYENAGHGLLHGALIAADLNDADSVNAKLMRFAKDDYYYSSLATSHYNNKGVFATDVVNSVPTIMMEMLATTDTGTLELLPALPKGLKHGSISGMKGKSRFTIDDLDWDMDTHKVKVTLTSDIDQNLTLIQRSGIEQVTGAPVQNSPLGGIARVVPLKAGQPVTLELTLRDTSRVNLALNKPATASSQSNTDQGPAKAFDGDPASRWAASQDPASWIQVDLGGIYSLSEVDLAWEASYAKRYRLQVSMDGQSWKDVFAKNDSTGGTERIPVSALGRFVRMQGVERSGQWGYSLYEMEVYGAEAPNIALGKTATASSASNASQGAAAAFDGDRTTRWSASQAPDNWLQVDLGDTYTVNRVAIDWEDSYAKGYKLQTSPDGRTWTDRFTETNGNGGTDLIDLNADARFVRMQGTQLSGQWGYSIYEMKVYGSLPDTATTIAVSGVTQGESYDDSENLTIGWEVAGSGVTSVTGTLDGEPFTSGSVAELYRLPLGEHTLTVTVENRSGGRVDQSVTFSTVTSTDAISVLIERFRTAGELSASGAAKLDDRISKVMVSEDKGRERDKKKIVKKLERFVDTVNDPKIVLNPLVKTTFLRDANHLITANDGEPV